MTHWAVFLRSRKDYSVCYVLCVSVALFCLYSCVCVLVLVCGMHVFFTVGVAKKWKATALPCTDTRENSKSLHFWGWLDAGEPTVACAHHWWELIRRLPWPDQSSPAAPVLICLNKDGVGRWKTMMPAIRFHSWELARRRAFFFFLESDNGEMKESSN